jgi:hypothetical protein
MSEPFYEDDPLEELQAMAAAAERLAREPEAFSEAFEAFIANDCRALPSDPGRRRAG